METIDRREKMALRRAVWLRNYQRARGRALTRLAQQYPDQFKEILEEERLSDEANGKTWLDISGTTAANLGFYVPPHRSGDAPGPKQTNRDEQNQSNDGGKA